MVDPDLIEGRCNREKCSNYNTHAIIQAVAAKDSIERYVKLF